ncbi:hypothetical protein GRI97_15915 [Altererythrobacter xixiisoli]|uniref:Uncharacterized protein n=1 Tax=Croceibacterium xixiisoli TaxID=1476466 RepID=A0A6I4TWR4_9SPHN|nr:hypothetical protein [Croceibacterium xixiisoli]MXP00477.1 hypothetical protein [Croceibacterium xixiisoli]
MNYFKIFPIEPQTAPMKFHDIPLLEVLALIEQFGFTEVELFDPDKFVCKIRINERGTMHITDGSTARRQMMQPPRSLLH